jgi:ferric-dicitrate binding protein FerR (iron transport regulator)/TolA-binding protein
MTARGKKSADELLVEALRAHRPDVPELGPSRLELERRRLMARLADGESDRAFSRFGGLRVRGLAAAAAAIVIAAIAIALFTLRGGESVVALSGEWRLERGDAIASGALISVPRGSRAALVLTDGSRIWADGDARLRVVEGKGLAVKLLAGRLAAQIAKRSPASDAFVVSTEFGEVSVMGTTFTVAVEPEGMIVRLYEGRVRLSSAGRSVTLSPGRSARAARDGIAALSTVAEEERRADLAFVDGDLTRLVRREPDASESKIAPKPAEGEAKADLDQAETAIAPKSETAPKPAEGAAKAGDPLDRLVALWRAGRYTEIVALTQEPGTPPGQLFYRGKALGALGRWAEAGGAYADAAAAGGEQGGEALYLAAAAHHKAGNLPDSLAMSERAASRGGPNADHARRLVFISLLGLGRYGDAGRSASDYLSAFPEGAHVAEARFVVGTGLRLSKSWAAAATAYAGFTALGRGEPQMRDDAAFYVGYCQLMAGSAAEGKKNLELYLAGYPSGRHVEQARAALSN